MVGSLYYQPYPYPLTRQNVDDVDRFMTVYGEGFVSVEPNVARVTVGVVTQNVELTAAQQSNAEIVERVIQAVLGAGVSRENIQTSDYSIRPQYDYVDGVQQFRGYEVIHMMRVTIDDIPTVGAVIDAAVEAGANRVQGVNFSVQNESDYVQLALNRALEDAVRKARGLAQTMNTSIDPLPERIIERVEAPPQLYQTFVLAESTGTPIEPGQLDIRAQVEARFRFGV